MSASLHATPPDAAVESASTPAPRPLYIGPVDRRLFAWHHAPSGGVHRNAAVVLCAPIANESTGAHRAFRHWAVALAAAGFHALRFDYHGFGDSAGSPDDPDRLAAWIASVREAVRFTRESLGVSHVAVAGLHFGATLALAAAAEVGDVDALVLWVPYATGRAYLREGRAFTALMADNLNLEANPLPEGAEQIGGLTLSVETLGAIEACDPLAGRRLTAPTLVIPRDAAAADATLMRNLSAAGASVDRIVVDGYAGVMTEPHQSHVPTAVIAATTEWLAARFPVSTAAQQPAASEASELAVVARNVDGQSTVTEQPMFFGPNRALFGIVSRPDESLRRQTGVLLVNAGAVYRVGPNRLYVELARRWAALGYTVVRLDIGGLGDSAAPPGAEENRSYPSHVVDDIEGSLDDLRALGVDRIVVAGLCSGAHATFHAGRELDSVDGLIVINPIVFYWRPTDPLDVGAWKTYVEARYYSQSARRWSSWLRLFKGRVSLLYIARVGLRRGMEFVKARIAAVTRQFRREIHEPENAVRDLRRIAASGTDVLLMFSADDPGLDFLEMRYPTEFKRVQQAPSFTLRVIEDADHTFTARASRQRAADALTEHLLAHHP